MLIKGIRNNWQEEYFFNGSLHKDDGPAIVYFENNIISNYFFYLEGNNIGIYSFVQQTNHLICKICYDFCKQSCF